MYSEEYCLASSDPGTSLKAVSFLISTFRKKYNRSSGIYVCPDVIPEIVQVTAPSTASPTTTSASTSVAQGHHQKVPRTTAQTPIQPQTGSEVDSVQVSHGENWTGLEIFGATTGMLFLIYIGLNVRSALCPCVSAGLDVWCP